MPESRTIGPVPDSEPTREQELALEQILASSKSTTRLRHWDEFGHLIPKIPVVKPARIPRPPPLPADATPEVMFKILARTWWQVIDAYFGAKDYTFKRAFVLKDGKPGHPRRHKHWKLLTTAAARMLELEITPVDWVRFRCDAWVEMQSGNGYDGAIRPPPLNFVFASSGFDKHLNWFDAFVADYSGGTMVMGPKQKALLARWTQMRFDCQSNLQLSVEQIVEQHFPDFCYAELLKEARAEAAEIQARLETMVARGEYVWKQYAPLGA